MRLSNKLHDLLLNQSLVSAVDVEACLKAAEALRGEAAHAFIDSALADCRALYAEQRSQEALPVARTCVQLADSLNNTPLLIRAKTALGNLLSMSGQWAEAMSLYSDLLQQAATGHDWRTVAACLVNTGNLYYRAGLPQLAMESYQSLLCSDLQVVEALITYSAAYGMAQCQMALGRHCAGLKSLEMALALNGAVADPYRSSVVYKTHSGLLMQAGRLGEAGEAIARLMDIAREHDSPRIRLEMLPAVGSYEMACGHVERGYHRLLEALDLARDTQHEVPYVLMTLIQALAKSGRSVDAEDYCLQLARQMSITSEVPPPPLQQVTQTDIERKLLKMRADGLSFKAIALELGRTPRYWSKQASRLYQRMGVKNSSEACKLMQDAAEINFPYIAVEKGLILALGWRTLFLSETSRTLARSNRISIEFLANVCLTPIDQLIIAFKTYQRRGDKARALQMAAAINKHLIRAQELAEAGAAAMALTFDR